MSRQTDATKTNIASGSALSGRFGALVRERREAMKIHQNDLALSTGVGRRFIIDLEAGKPSCHLGKALLVAEAVGLRIFDLLMTSTDADNALLPELLGDADPPANLPDDIEEIPEGESKVTQR